MALAAARVVSRVAWALAVVLATGALPARANCSCDTVPACDPTGEDGPPCDCAGPVTCDAATFNKLTHSEQDATTGLKHCMTGNRLVAAELSACHVRTAETEAPPSGPGWGLAILLFMLGVVAGGLAF